MNRLLATASSLAVLAIASQASAADLAARTAPVYSKAPEYVQPVYNWTGFYIGGSLGARTSDVTWTSVNFTDSGGFDGLVDDPRNGVGLGNTSARVGAYLGYNWQVSPLFVLGLEGDAAWANNAATSRGFPGVGDSNSTTLDSVRVKMGWDGSIRGRVGFLAAPNVLIYGTGGVAWQQVDATSKCSDESGFCGNGTPFTGVTSTTKTGWTAGGGIEALITPHVALRGEYRFSDFGHISNQLPPAPSEGINADIRLRTNIATFGVAYKF